MPERRDQYMRTYFPSMVAVSLMILIFFVLPITRILVGTSIGATAACVPLSIAAAPFVARMVEQSLEEIDDGVIEAAKCMGATKLQISTSPGDTPR